MLLFSSSCANTILLLQIKFSCVVIRNPLAALETLLHYNGMSYKPPGIEGEKVVSALAAVRDVRCHLPFEVCSFQSACHSRFSPFLEASM